MNKRFPENGHVDIDDSGLVIRRAERQKPPPELEAFDEAIRSQMNDASILDVLTETEKWLDLHRLFGPLSGFESKVDDPRKRFITTLFCYGCNLGPTQTARPVKVLSRRQVAWHNLKHVTEQRLDKAIVKVINAYNRFALPRYWGSGKSASADGTKLVANMVILHNFHGMSRILKGLQAKGYVLTEEILRGTAPYRREHINRFGEYPLDLDREVEPINYKIDLSI